MGWQSGSGNIQGWAGSHGKPGGNVHGWQSESGGGSGAGGIAAAAGHAVSSVVDTAAKMAIAEGKCNSTQFNVVKTSKLICVY